MKAVVNETMGAVMKSTMSRHRSLLAAGFLAALLLGGCAGPGGPAAWDKSFIAKPEMSMGWNSLGTRADLQVYESKEGASGGYGVGGGGCGCN